jgi:hypothetical protein
MQFNATLKPNGKLEIHRKNEMVKWLISEAREKDRSFLVTIERVKRKRSSEVNRYWWGVVIPVIHSGLVRMGHDVTKQDAHDFLKANFCFTEILNESTGEIVRVPRGTSSLSGSEFWELIEKTARFAAEYLGEVIPPPNEQSTLNLQ